jgi:hypothetical protein
MFRDATNLAASNLKSYEAITRFAINTQVTAVSLNAQTLVGPMNYEVLLNLRLQSEMCVNVCTPQHMASGGCDVRSVLYRQLSAIYHVSVGSTAVVRHMSCKLPHASISLRRMGTINYVQG